MADVMLTPQQRLALETQSSSIALNAGAGCGKTFVLANRLLREIAPPAGRPLSRITALTFTNKAARELRDRVRSYCRKEWNASVDPSLRSAWRNLVRELEAAPISTFHVFCGKILKRFSVEAGIDPGFTLLEGPLGPLQRDQAIEAMLREALIEGDADLMALAVDHGLGFVASALALILEDASFADVRERTPADSTGLIHHWHTLWLEQIRPRSLDALMLSAEAVLDVFNGFSFQSMAKMQARKERLAEMVPRLSTSQNVGKLLEEIRAEATIQHVKFADVATKEACQAAIDNFRAVYKTHAASLEVDPDQSRPTAAALERLLRLSDRARRSFQESKRLESTLDFNDLLLETRNLLRHRADDVRAALAAELDTILIDEFQDTDPIQEEIVRWIAGDDYAGGRLFIVGDVKQSIYGFRGAQPDLFSRLQSEFPEQGRLPLSQNFRSLPAVLDFVNALFADAFPETYEPLLPGIATPIELRDEPAVFFLWDDPLPEGEKESAKVDELRREEGRRIASLIQDLIATGRLIRDRATDTLRPITAGDVAILFRSLNDLGPYERGLSEAGIDHHVIGGRAFYAQQEIADITNVLTCVEDPFHAVALAGALRSPMFGLSDEALFWLSHAGRQNLTIGLEAAARGEVQELSPIDQSRAERAWHLLTSWRSRKDRDSIERLIDRIYDESGYECSLLGESLGDRKRANARKLLKLARVYDGEGSFSLADFVARLRADMKTPPKEAEAATTDEEGDVVRLLSIHQSKGLEFPVVIVPDLNRREPRSRSSLAIDPVAGLVMSGAADSDDEFAEPEPNLGWLVHQKLQSEREEAEALRVFYVATTRARDILVLSSASKPEAGGQSTAFKLLERRFDVLSGACVADLPSGWRPPQVEVVRRSDLAPRRRVQSSGADLLGVARRIEEARVNSLAVEEPTELRRPLELSIDPSAGLSPRLARLDRLVRDMLADPAFFDPQSRQSAINRAVLLQPSIVSESLLTEALGRLDRIIAGPFARTLAESKQIKTRQEFQLIVTGSSPDRTLSGVIDLAYESSAGLWNLVTISLVELDEDRERFRCWMNAFHAGVLGFDPLGGCWSLTLGDGGRLATVDPFKDNDERERIAAEG